MGNAVGTLGLPEGFVLDQNIVPEADPTGLPEGFVIDQPAQPAPPTQQEEPGFFSRIGERLAGRAETFREITAEPAESTLESLGKGVQVLGNVAAGAAVDVVGETVMTGFDLLSQGLSAITPDAIEDPIISRVGDAFESLAGTDAAQSAMKAAAQGIEAYQAWAIENAEVAKIASALGNIALVAAPIKGKPAIRLGPPAPTAVGRVARAATEAGNAQVASRRRAFLNELVRPLPTKKSREAAALLTTEGKGLFGTRTVAPSPRESSMAQALENIQAVKPSNTVQQNLTAIQKAIETEAGLLATTLKASPVRINRADTFAKIEAVMTRLKSDPLLVGDAATTAKRTIAKAQSLLASNPNTPAGILKTRREFDAWVRKIRPKAFDPVSDNAVSAAVRETRQTLNNIISSNAPSARVKESLLAQSNMFRASENLAQKAPIEASNRVGRFAQRVKGAIGLDSGFSNLIPQVATTVALTGATALAPTAVAGGVALLALGAGAKRLVSSPAVKKSIGNLLRQSERAIQKAKSEGNKELVRQLRTDRAAVIEVFRNLEVSESKPPKQEGEPSGQSSGVLVPFNPDIHTPKDVGLGGPSTEFLITEEAPGGGFWNIPSIWWDSSGNPQILPAEQAQARALAFEELTGKRFPRFASPEEGSESAKQRSQSGGASKSMLATLPKRGN